MISSRRTQSPQDRGFALIVVLWAGLLLALVAAGFASAVRSRLRTTAAKVETARAQGLADAAINIAILDIAKAQQNAGARRFPADATPIVCRIGEAAVIIKVADEEGKVNLNTASEEVLRALFEGLGASTQDARSFTDRIEDFRDSDSDRRALGAEKDDYEKAGLRGPKNADFTSVVELDQVLGLPADIVARAKPLLTTALVHTGVDPAVASKPLREMLARGASAFVRNATAGDPNSIFNDADFPVSFRVQSSQQAYAVTVHVLLDQTTRYTGEAALIVRGRQLPVFRYWRRGDAQPTAEETAKALATRDPC